MDLVDGFSDAHEDGPDIRAMFRDIARGDASPADKYGQYQTLLDSTHGPSTFDRVIQHAVRKAYSLKSQPQLTQALAEDPWLSLDPFAAAMERDLDGWHIPIGLDSFAHIVATHRERIGRMVITTNFDPLIEIALRRHGVEATTVNLPTDGNLDAVVPNDGSLVVVHLHGYWWRPVGAARHGNLHSDALLRGQRGTLRADLRGELARSVVLVVGYSGWNDLFSRAVRERSSDGFRGLLWALHAATGPDFDRIKEMFVDDSGQPIPQATIYSGVDCDHLFPTLDAQLAARAGRVVTALSAPERPVSLDDEAAESAALGAKISKLARLRRAGVPVPPGLAVRLPAENADWPALANMIIAAVNERDDMRGATLIVRSSASVEDQSDTLFPGIFDSPRDVKNVVALTAALDRCYSSLRSAEVSNYLKAQTRPTNVDEIRMSVLIQHQVECVYSGVAFTGSTSPLDDYELLVELTEGSSASHLRGSATGSLFGFPDSTESSPVRLGGPQGEFADVARVLEEVRRLCASVRVALAEERLDIEWAWDGRTAYVVQARTLPSTPVQADDLDDASSTSAVEAESVDIAVERELPLDGIREFGLKGAATQYFDSSGIGGVKNLKLIPPGANEEQIRELLRDRESPDGTTIRFSHKAKLSLPRRFIEPDEDIVEAFVQLRTNIEWLGIVSDFVHVRRSFEAYVGEHDLLVEHVPGNWETDNVLPPDLFIWGAVRRFLRVSTTRMARYEMPGDQNERRSFQSPVPPLSVDEASAFCSAFLPKLKQIKERFSGALPLNVHFTSDDDGMYFLNIRPTAELDLSNVGTNPGGTFRLNRLYPIANARDLDAWDGKTAVLLTVSEDRNRFAQFIDVARRLSERKVRAVYCTFGLLSHPAILMRELGIHVRPLLLTHDEVPIDMGGW